MGQKKTINKTLGLQLGIAIAVFVVALFSSVFGYVSNYKNDARETVHDDIDSIAERYADEVRVGIKDCVDISEVVADLIEFTDTDGSVVGDAVSALYSLGYVEDISIIDEYGKGYGIDGEDIDFSEKAFWKEMNHDEEIQIIPMIDDSEHNHLMIINSTVKDDVVYHIVVAYSFDRFLQSIKSDEFDKMAVYMVTADDGTVLTVNKISSQFASQTNMCDTFSTDITKYGDFVDGIKTGKKAHVDAEINGEKRTIFTVPVGNYRVNVIVAVNDSHIGYKIKQEIKQVVTLERLVILYVIGYVLVLAFMLIRYRLSLDTSKQQLEEKADTDLLTGLNNKVATERKIKNYIETHPDEPGMFIIFDIDKFKKINDTQGHAFGDEVLRTLGEQIGSQFRVTDIVGRIGGDEFMIFLKNISSEEIAKKEAEKLMLFFKAFKAGGEYIKYSATASVGVAMFPEDGKSFDLLYKAADNALYYSKENGRNQLNFHNKEWGTIVK